MLKETKTTIVAVCDVCEMNNIKLTIKGKQTDCCEALEKEGWQTIGNEHRCPSCEVILQDRKDVEDVEEARLALRVYRMRSHPDKPSRAEVGEQVGEAKEERLEYLYSWGYKIAGKSGVQAGDGLFVDVAARLLAFTDEEMLMYLRHERCLQCGLVHVPKSRGQRWECNYCPTCVEDYRHGRGPWKKRKRGGMSRRGLVDVTCPHCGYTICSLPVDAADRHIGCGNCGVQVEW